MNTETKVGAFVVAGLGMLALAIFLLGEFSLEKRYAVYVLFDDLTGLSVKAPVRLAGVEVGRVTAIELAGNGAKATAMVRKGVVIYRDAAFTVGSTGIIGSKFLQIDQGHPESGALAAGSVAQGRAAVSIEQALTKALGSLQDLTDGLSGKPGKESPLTRNINATVESLKASVDNLRSLTANLDDLVSDTKPELTRALTRLDDITAKLDSTLGHTSSVAASLNSSSGTVGALLHDPSMRQEVQETVHDARLAMSSVKDVLAGLTKWRVFWNYDWRYEHAIRQGRADLGITLKPRDDRYYYVGGSNLGNEADAPDPRDYQRLNRADALLGFQWGGVDLAVGVLRSAGGGRLTWTPFKDKPVLGRFSLFGQAYDFGRDRVINTQRLQGAQVDVGGMVRLHRLVGIGARVEDVRQVSRYQTWANVSFEDKDVSYLFGLVTFGASGKKGRSGSN